MNLFKFSVIGVVTATLTACSTGTSVGGGATSGSSTANSFVAAQGQRDYALHSFQFSIPDDLKVSEANGFYPIADIVWRGDPLGDRRQQITEIFETSIQSANANLGGSRPVTVDVQLLRFHSLTERTRYSVGGTHSIKFNMTVLDAQTGEVLEETRRINADLSAFGGNAALRADAEGRGMKVRITSHLADLFLQELN